MHGILVMAWVESKSCGISGILLVYCYLCVSTGLESFGSEHDVELVRICLILVWCACDFFSFDFIPTCNPCCFCFLGGYLIILSAFEIACLF